MYLCAVKNNKIFGIDLDVMGTGASLLCAIHCAVTPIAVSYGVLAGMNIFENEKWDLALILISAILAITSLVNGYTKKHHDKTPLYSAFIGFTIIAIGHLGMHSGLGHMITAVGGVMIAFAHVHNAALRRSVSKFS